MSDTHAAEGRRPGRPPKDESEKRIPLSLRITPDLRSALEAAAKDENRSLTQLSEFALASFLEARKHQPASKDVSPAAPPPSTEKVHVRLVPLGASLKHQHQPADVFGRAFGRDVTSLLLLIGCLVKDILYYSKYKNIERTWLADPQTFGEVKEAIITLLQLIGPDEQPSLFTAAKKALWGTEQPSDDKLNAPTCVAGELAFEFGWDNLDPWAPVIRDWLGEGVVARVRQRLSHPPEGQNG